MALYARNLMMSKTATDSDTTHRSINMKGERIRSIQLKERKSQISGAISSNNSSSNDLQSVVDTAEDVQNVMHTDNMIVTAKQKEFTSV